ncbi:hypothetical protein BH10ACT2_BH10ACT2_20230 [soil metagenome]
MKSTVRTADRVYPIDTATQPLFAGLVGPALLSNGNTVEIFAAQPADIESVREFYAHLSDSATWARFLGARPYIPDAELRDVVAQDVRHHVTMLAAVEGAVIGIGEFVVTSKPNEAEVAFAVADDHHREGIATLLLERLAVVARRCGIERFVANTMFGNGDMQLVFRTVGLAVTTSHERDVVNVTLDLTSIEALQASTADRLHQAEAATTRSTQ